MQESEFLSLDGLDLFPEPSRSQEVRACRRLPAGSFSLGPRGAAGAQRSAGAGYHLGLGTRTNILSAKVTGRMEYRGGLSLHSEGVMGRSIIFRSTGVLEGKEIEATVSK